MNNTLKQSTILFAILLYLISINFQVKAQSNSQPANTPLNIDLQTAVSNKWITASFTGTGASTGDAIMLEVKRMIMKPMKFTIISGTTLKSQNSNKQNMIIQKVKGKMTSDTSYIVSDVIDLSKEDKATYVLEAYCLDFEKENPDASTSFTIAGVDTMMQKILSKGRDSSSTPQVIQSAIWMYSDNVQPDQIMEKIPASPEDIEKARKLVQSVK